MIVPSLASPPFASRRLLFANTSTVIGACQVLRKLSLIFVFNFFGTSVNGYIYMNIRLILISLIDLQVSSNPSNTGRWGSRPCSAGSWDGTSWLGSRRVQPWLGSRFSESAAHPSPRFQGSALEGSKVPGSLFSRHHECFLSAQCPPTQWQCPLAKYRQKLRNLSYVHSEKEFPSELIWSH